MSPSSSPNYYIYSWFKISSISKPFLRVPSKKLDLQQEIDYCKSLNFWKNPPKPPAWFFPSIFLNNDPMPKNQSIIPPLPDLWIKSKHSLSNTTMKLRKSTVRLSNTRYINLKDRFFLTKQWLWSSGRNFVPINIEQKDMKVEMVLQEM